MLVQNTAYDAVCDEGEWPKRVARLEEFLCVFVLTLVEMWKKNVSHLCKQVRCTKIKTWVLFQHNTYTVLRDF